MVTVSYEDGDRLRVSIRGHEVFTDQPQEDGGGDTAPTPTELFIAGLGACVGLYAERFLRRNQLPAAGLQVTCSYTWAEGPHRVGEITLDVEAPGLPPEKRAAFERVIERCAVHNTLEHPPAIALRVSGAQTAAA
ncbi:MAG TPA: OsmC family protein [Candidatus Dormibacteraeota bacterium]|nr:OsmC family protein [Candidatus Dormibacteraeota bacterium]